MNDQSLRFRMLADGGFHPILNPVTARRLQLRYRLPKRTIASPARGRDLRISDVAFEVGGRSANNYAFWSDRPLGAADGTLGPYGVPQRVVTFRLRSSASGERTFVFPLTNLHDDAVDEIDPGMGTFIRVGAARVFVRFDLTRDDVLATASVAAELAEHNGGEVHRVAGSSGTPNAVRHMLLVQPVLIGPLRLEKIAVAQNAVAPPRVPGTGEDMRAIVVTGRRRDDVLPTLSLGRDAMRKCSKLTFDRAKGQIALSCVPA